MIALCLSVSRVCLARPDSIISQVLAGEGVGLVGSIDGAEEIVRKVEAEAVAAIRSVSAMVADEEVEAPAASQL